MRATRPSSSPMAFSLRDGAALMVESAGDI
jgi:hypothetical protein